MADEILVFGGSASIGLTEAVCGNLGVPPGKCRLIRFPEGNLFVKIEQNVRGSNVYLIQSTAFPANDNFMELLFWIDAFKRASAESVTAIIPYFAYAKGDKKDEPRVSIRARVCADAVEAAGADRVVTMDLHAPQIQGFFKVPVDDLYALPVLCEAIGRLGLADSTVVSPDPGFLKKARLYADCLGAGLAVADKERLDHDGEMAICGIIGNVKGHRALIVDDFTVTGGTLVKVAARLMEAGASEVNAAVTHGVFTHECMERLDRSAIGTLLTTDSIETQPVKLSSKVEVVSVAPLFAEAIRRIHNRQSISVLFDREHLGGQDLLGGNLP
ncbi:MAG: ribose-phosphate diphosphokinase [Planctomycetota bacterium]|jgi:ribose-phosphate pyrophosphokinase